MPVGNFAQEFGGEQWNVLQSLLERRKLDDDGRNPIVEIETKRAFLDKELQVLVGGGNQPEVDGAWPIPSYTLHNAILQHTQKLCLDVEWHIADLIKKNCASFSLL